MRDYCPRDPDSAHKLLNIFGREETVKMKCFRIILCYPTFINKRFSSSHTKYPQINSVFFIYYIYSGEKCPLTQLMWMLESDTFHLLVICLLHSTLSQFHVLFIKYYKNKLTKPEILFINILAIYSLHLKDSANTQIKNNKELTIKDLHICI